MCGIAGFAGDGEFEDLRRMTDSLVHRGPDEEGYWHREGDPVQLGFRRLAIVDLGDGSQPMWDASGEIGVVFNCDI